MILKLMSYSSGVIFEEQIWGDPLCGENLFATARPSRSDYKWAQLSR